MIADLHQSPKQYCTDNWLINQPVCNMSNWEMNASMIELQYVAVTEWLFFLNTPIAVSSDPCDHTHQRRFTGTAEIMWLP